MRAFRVCPLPPLRLGTTAFPFPVLAVRSKLGRVTPAAPPFSGRSPIPGLKPVGDPAPACENPPELPPRSIATRRKCSSVASTFQLPPPPRLL